MHARATQLLSTPRPKPDLMADAAAMAATRMQAQFRGIQGRHQAAECVVPTTLAGRCAILRREMGLSGGNLKDVVHQAAGQLGVDSSDERRLIDIAKSCMEILGLEPKPGTSPAVKPAEQRSAALQRLLDMGFASEAAERAREPKVALVVGRCDRDGVLIPAPRTVH